MGFLRILFFLFLAFIGYIVIKVMLLKRKIMKAFAPKEETSQEGNTMRLCPQCNIYVAESLKNCGKEGCPYKD